MAKTQEELNELETELVTLNKKISELNEEELENIAGGMISFEPLYELLHKNNIIKYQLLKNGVLVPSHITDLSTAHLIDIICEKFNIDREELLEYLNNYKEEQ